MLNEKFQKFGKKSNTITKERFPNAVIYTRVSTSEQENNFSLETQLEKCEKCAKNNELSIIKKFGGVSESAKTDDRKEFNEMLKNKTLPNYYETLGLSQSSTSTQIKDKFRLLAKEWHPDKRKDGSEEKMAEINQAYEVLSNQQLRKEYDKYFSLL